MRKFLSTLTIVGVCSLAVPAFAAETTTETAVETTVEATAEVTADDAIEEEATETDVDATEEEATETEADATEEEATETDTDTIVEETTPPVVFNPVTEKIRLDYVVDTDEEDFTHTYTYYVISHSAEGKSYWASSIDGSKNLWFHEYENKGAFLSANDNFQATFDKDGRLLSIEKYNLQ